MNKEPFVSIDYKLLAMIVIVSGAILRILLYWANPPGNAFDDHFEPIIRIMESGSIPAKDACWQCYHPPIFYWVSAQIGNLAVYLGANPAHLFKILHLIPCLYGIATLAFIYLILNRLPLSDFSKIIALTTACFLPRNIYMSAIHSNDSMSYLLVALSIYLLLVAIDREYPVKLLIAVGISIAGAIFVKYTAFILFPVVLNLFFLAYFFSDKISGRSAVSRLIITLMIPFVVMCASSIANLKNYGTPLPWNINQVDPEDYQYRDESPLDFVRFTPWESLKSPILKPGNMHHFWDVIHNGMWFDNEPRFLYFLDSDNSWWKKYYAWLRGEVEFPGDNKTLPLLTKIVGFGGITLGLVPLILILGGVLLHIKEEIWTFLGVRSIGRLKKSLFPVLLVGNVVGIIILALRLQVFSAMKASYLLPCLPASVFYIAMGVMRIEKNILLKRAVVTCYGVIIVLVSLHVLHIYWTLRPIS